jgi:hypothetical protein
MADVVSRMRLLQNHRYDEISFFVVAKEQAGLACIQIQNRQMACGARVAPGI